MASIASAGSCFYGRPDCAIPPQANKRCPRSKTLIAPTWSALFSYSQATQANSACVLRFSAAIWPQHGYVRLVLTAETATKKPPRHAVLYSSWRRNSPHPWLRIALLSPDFARTLRPGASEVPAADRLRRSPSGSSREHSP